jgi:hypothetical protein
MKLMLLERSRVLGAQSVKVLKLSMQAFFNFLMLGDASGLSGVE